MSNVDIVVFSNLKHRAWDKITDIAPICGLYSETCRLYDKTRLVFMTDIAAVKSSIYRKWKN